MPYTDAELLTQWQTARDRIVLALTTGNSKVRYRIGNTEVEYEATERLLNLANSEIARLTNAGNVSRGRHRNYIRFQRH